MDGEQEVTELTVELKRVIDDVKHICLSCGTIVEAPIFGLLEKKSGALVNIMVVHAKPFTCKLCKKRIELLESKENAREEKKPQGSFLKLKEIDPVELRMFVREMIIPEIIEALKDHSFTSGIELMEALEEALGLKK